MFTFLTTTMLVLQVQASTLPEAIQEVRESGYTIAKIM